MEDYLPKNGSIVYLSLFEKDQKFSSEQQSNIYEFDFDTMTLKKTNIINYKAYSDKAVTDGKYIFYKVTKNYGFSQPVLYSSVHKCDIDKSNETDINVVNLAYDDILYPYGNCMYTTISDNGINIARIYGNGGTHKITNYTDYGYMLSILEISAL